MQGQCAGGTPWDPGYYIFRDKDISNLGHKCIANGCECDAVKEIGVECDTGGNDIYCLCEDHEKNAVDMLAKAISKSGPDDKDEYQRGILWTED